jgi:2-polyprenyl-6-methoxyphenol hydroxylase-like FAD-dependent oxidoreductase
MHNVKTLRVALVGGGIGGLTAALALSQRGFETHVFEQAGELREIGAGITLSANAIKALRALGLENALRSRGFESDAIVGRDWTTTRPTFRVPLKGASQARFGAPHIDIHRADLLEILASMAGAGNRIELGRRCVAVSSTLKSATLTLSDGRTEEFDLVVGCDGIHSIVRAALHGPQPPRFTGNMCWRALIPADRISSKWVPPDVTIWTGPAGHIVTFYIRGGSLLNLVAVREISRWMQESWLIEGNTSELVAAYPEVHDDLQTLLQQTEHCFKWGLFDRDPLPRWSSGRVTLLGDAAHPMLPFLGQGGAMAIEDAIVLAGALAHSSHDVAAALLAYEAERVPRTAQVQLAVRRQGKVFHRRSPAAKVQRSWRSWLERFGVPHSRDLNTDWLYAYDPTCISFLSERVGGAFPTSPNAN